MLLHGKWEGERNSSRHFPTRLLGSLFYLIPVLLVIFRHNTIQEKVLSRPPRVCTFSPWFSILFNFSPRGSYLDHHEVSEPLERCVLRGQVSLAEKAEERGLVLKRPILSISIHACALPPSLRLGPCSDLPNDNHARYLRHIGALMRSGRMGEKEAGQRSRMRIVGLSD